MNGPPDLLLVPYKTSPAVVLFVPPTFLALKSQVPGTFGSLHAPSSPTDVWLASGRGNSSPSQLGQQPILSCGAV